MKPGGTVAIIAEIYKGALRAVAKMAEAYIPLSGMKFLTADEHRRTPAARRLRQRANLYGKILDLLDGEEDRESLAPSSRS